jgi:transcriptional regulator with XRE-family HTH domain
VGNTRNKTAIAFGRVLRALRQDAGMTQEELGLEADLRRTYVSILELGQQQPSLESLLKLAAALKVRPGDMVDKTVDLLPEKNC